MRKITLTLVAAAAVWSGAAQEPAAKRWTLRECIDYAVENNVEIRQTALNVESAEIDLNTAQNSRLPSLSANLDQSFGFGRTQIDTGATPVFHNSQSSNTSLSLSAGMTVFQGGRINNQVKMNRLQLAAAVEGLERAKQNLELTVAAAFLEVLFQKEVLEVYREQILLTRRQVANTAAMVKAEKAALSQLYDIEADLAQNEVNEINASNDLALSLLNLSQALNLPDDTDFDIVEIDPASLHPASRASLRSPDEIYAAAVGIRPVVKEAEIRLQSSEYQVKMAQAAYWPSVSLGASFGDGYQYLFGVSGQQTLSEQLNQHRESVGVSMSIPIFNRNATRNSVKQARLAVKNNTLALEGVRLALYKEIEQAWQGAVAAHARHEATSKALTAAQEAARTMELRYEEGKATAYEYSDAYTRLISSRSNMAQAKFEYLFRTKILDFYSGTPITL